MTQNSLGVAVIGAGMVGRAHAAGYRVASQLYDLDLPEIRLVADRRRPRTVRRRRRQALRLRARRRPPGRRSSTRPTSTSSRWPSPTSCTGPSSRRSSPPASTCCARSRSRPSVEDAKAMVAAAEAADTQSGVGFSFRRTPGINAIREQLESGAIGAVAALQRPLLVRLRPEPEQPDELALQGRAGHRRAGGHRQPHDRPRASTSAVRSRASAARCSRPSPPSVRCRSAPPSGTRPARSATRRSRWRTRTSPPSPRTFANGAVGTFSISRISHGLPTDSASRCSPPTAPPRSTSTGPGSSPSPTTVRTGRPTATARCSSAPSTRASRRASPWTSRPSATARTTCSPGRHAPSSTRWPGSASSPPVPSLAHGLHNMEILAAVTQSALSGGQAVTLA